MEYVRLDHTVIGFNATLTNQTWPGAAVPAYNEKVSFHLQRRAQPQTKMELPVNVDWPSLYVHMANCTGELERGYYEGWFVVGCQETCKVFFMVNNKLCFNLCPDVDEPTCVKMLCDKKPEPLCGHGEVRIPKPQYTQYRNGISILFGDSECIPDGCEI